jgi:hypothetical protein
MHLCTCVSEEGGDGETVCVCRVALQEPMYLCTCVSEEVGDREGPGEGGDASNVL